MSLIESNVDTTTADETQPDEESQNEIDKEGDHSSSSNENLLDKSESDKTEEPSSDVWFYDKNIPGEGERPPELLDKFESAMEQARAYPELEKKFGAFTGAPEEYDTDILKDENVDFNPDAPLFKKFKETAKELNVSQDAFNKLLSVYTEDLKSRTVNPEEEMKKLGDNASEQIQRLSNWASNNLSEEEYNIFGTMATTAEQVRVLQKLRSLSQEKPVPDGNTANNFKTELTEPKIQKMVADPRYKTDKDYRAEVRKKIAQFHGE